MDEDITDLEAWQAFEDLLPEDTSLTDLALRLYHDAGMHPAARRVWDEGRDVTDADPESWPQLWKDARVYDRSNTGRNPSQR